MKRFRGFFKKGVALLLAAVCVVTMMSAGVFGFGTTAHATNGISAILQSGTFANLLQASISAGVKSGATAALTPMISLIGQKYFGLPADAGLTEIKERLAKIEGQLEDIRAELEEGFKEVLAELEKNEQLSIATETLAEAEFLANIIMKNNSSALPRTIDELKDLSGEEQQRIIEINAEAIKAETVDALCMAVLRAKGYLTQGGYIDSNYSSAYAVYYNYMKKQTMFCGEAAMKSECFWELIKESYAKSCIALIYALEQQLAMYDLYEAEASDEIRQEAIDAAEIALSFGSRSVIENTLEQVRADAEEVLGYYCEFIEDARNEATVFINKGQCYIELAPELGRISFNGCESYADYVADEGFEKGGITEDVYKRTLEDTRYYYYGGGYYHIDTAAVSYDEFIRNEGKCIRYERYSDSSGSYDKPSDADWSVYSKYVFREMIFNMKLTKYNIANRPSDDVAAAVIDYVRANFESMSIADYLKAVGFSFGEGFDEADGIYMPTARFSLGNGSGSQKIESDGAIYELASLEKAKAGDFYDCIGESDPAGSFFWFENAKDTIGIKIVSEEMDGRIYNGVYTVEAKEIIGYNADGSPVYKLYKAVYEVEGSEIISIRLPASLDYKTIKVTLGYEGLGASSNHKNLCSFSLSACEEAPEELTLKMVGYTKIWLGYGVDAEILCDGVKVADGKG